MMVPGRKQTPSVYTWYFQSVALLSFSDFRCRSPFVPREMPIFDRQLLGYVTVLLASCSQPNSHGCFPQALDKELKCNSNLAAAT